MHLSSKVNRCKNTLSSFFLTVDGRIIVLNPKREREKKKRKNLQRHAKERSPPLRVNIQDFSSSISQITFKRLEEKSNYEFKKKIRQDAFLHESYLGSNVPFYSIFPPRSLSSHWISNIFWFRAWLLEKLHRYTRPCFDREKRERGGETRALDSLRPVHPLFISPAAVIFIVQKLIRN